MSDGTSEVITNNDIILGSTALGVANAPLVNPEIYHVSFLKTHYFISIPLSDWITIVSFAFAVFWFGIAITRLISKIRK